jgi:hypothetical protein
VRARWEHAGATVAVTADGGALTVTLDERGALLTAEREQNRHYWQAQDAAHDQAEDAGDRALRVPAAGSAVAKTCASSRPGCPIANSPLETSNSAL